MTTGRTPPRTPPRKEKGQIWILSRSESGEWRVLLLKTLPERGAFWQPVTGSIEPGESIHKGALREAIEETGLPPLKNIEALGYEFSFEGKWGPSHETAYFYETYPGCPKVTLDPSEHQGYQWVSMNEAISLLHYEPNRQALLQLIRQMNTARLKKREKTGY
jgi:8-oxo-dGTP pyrophosphatase MutT (NUDIX family)